MGDCQRLYCEVRLQLVAGVVQARFQAYSREPPPALTRKGWAALMQARRPRPCRTFVLHSSVMQTTLHKTMKIMNPA